MNEKIRISSKVDETWGKLYWLRSDKLEIAVTADVGPRIIHCSHQNGPNLFATFPPSPAQDQNRWQLYGGHRLWHAPEALLRTYHPDNDPVEVEVQGNKLAVRQKQEQLTGIQKGLTVSITDQEEVCIIHRLTNKGVWPVELAPWAISVMAPGGFAIAPLSTVTHPDRLLPNRTITVWPYTDLRDIRYLFGKDHLLVRQQSNMEATKIGLLVTDGWAAYYNQPYLFVKRFSCAGNIRYPDFQSSVEIYANSDMLELETLGGLTTLPPGGSVTHTEHWEAKEVNALPFAESSAIRVSDLVEQ